MQKAILRSVLLSVVLFVLLGGLYPLVVTFFGKLFFPNEANGSLVYENKIPVGSKLIGQNFSKDIYFHGRPSSAGKGYDAANSSASNLAPTNKALFDKIENSISQVLKENPTIKRENIPIDLVTGSGSGLDPDISLDSAKIQIPRISKSRNTSEKIVNEIVDQHTQKPLFGSLGEYSVNVLELNLALDSKLLKK